VNTSASKARSRVRTQWLALGASLVVLAGVLVAWALSNAADRVEVVQVASRVSAGDVIRASDLGLASVAYDDAVTGLVPPESMNHLVGRVAAIDLEPGVLLQTGMWRDATHILMGEESVGALLAPGRFPGDLARGDAVLAAPVEGETASPAVRVRVLELETGTSGELVVTLAVPAAQSISVAQLAATGQLVLVGQPPDEPTTVAPSTTLTVTP
jgi:hypothetical protein